MKWGLLKAVLGRKREINLVLGGSCDGGVNLLAKKSKIRPTS